MRSLPRALIALCLLLALCAVPSAHADLCTACDSHPMHAKYLPLEWHLAVIHAPAGWAQGADGLDRHTGKRVGVFIIDTGIARSVPVLRGQIGPSFSPLQPVTLTTPPAYSPAAPIVVRQDPLQDIIGHGSFCASEVAGSGAYLGVAPRAYVGSGRVFGDDPGANDSDIITALYWGVNHGYSVISMSLGGGGYDPQFQWAVNYANAHGVLVVAASGNDGVEGDVWPASYHHVVRVTATSQTGFVTDWSSFGGDVAVAAPGESVFGYLPSTRNYIGGYGLTTLSGTSMATPLVAGVLADLLSYGLSPDDATAALIGGARYPKDLDAVAGQDAEHWGAGMVDLAGALAWARGHHLSAGYRGPATWKHVDPPAAVQQDTGQSSLPLPSSVFEISAASPM